MPLTFKVLELTRSISVYICPDIVKADRKGFELFIFFQNNKINVMIIAILLGLVPILIYRDKCDGGLT